jgi:hypothetical protein
MPSDDSIRFNEDESVGPVVPHLPNDNPEQPIGSTQFGIRLLALVNGQLLPKRDCLQCEFGL